MRRGKGSHPALHRLVWPRFGKVGFNRGGRARPVEDRPRKAAPERRPPFTFIAPLGLVRPMTRTHVRLLGPCFKTGRVGHRPFARRERLLEWRGCAPLLHDRRRAARTPEVSPFAGAARARDVGVPVRPGLRRPQQRVAATYITRGNTPAGADLSAGTPKSSWVASANPAPSRHWPTS